MVQATKPRKIILIVIDALRADHLGCYGYKRDTSPNIDEFARNSVFFRWPFSACSYTVPSHATMLTGKYPSNHTFGFVQGWPTAYDPDKEIMLQEVLSSIGYETAAFVSGFPMRKETGLSNGFRIYDDEFTRSELNRPGELVRDGSETNLRIFPWLSEKRAEKFFLFVHYFDVHGPYTIPEGFNEIFLEDEFYTHAIYLDSRPDHNPVGGIPAYQVLKPVRSKSRSLNSFERDSRYYIAQYDACVRYIDRAIANFVAKLKELRIYDECLLIVTADHGEAMGENNVWFFHGLTVTPEEIHIPLIIKPHNGWSIRPKTIETQVSQVDFFPTISELVGFDYSGLDIDGTSLVRLIEEGTDKELESRTIISEIEGQIAHIDRDRISVKPKRIDKDKLVFLLYVEDLCNKEMSVNYRRENTMLQWTGERYVPSMEGSEGHYEHLHRYRFAKEFMKGKKVLDLACGEGYGSLMLSEEAVEVVGIDIDETTIRHASSKYLKENLRFLRGSMTDIPIKGEEIFDVIVCFEALEHIEEHDKLLKEVKRLLKVDGIFIVSTPNKYIYSDQPSFHNTFHLKELYFDEFKDLLSKNFRSVLLYGQKVYPTSNIFPLFKESGPMKDFPIEKGDKEFLFVSPHRKVARYFIAAASDSSVDKNLGPGNSYLVDISEESLFRQMDAKISHLEASVGSLQGTLNHIYGWEVLLAFCKLIDKILPISSKRREAVKSVWNFFGTISTNMRLMRKKIFSKKRHNHLPPYQKKYYMMINRMFPANSHRRKVAKFIFSFLRKVFPKRESTEKTIFSKNRHKSLGPYQERYEEWLDENKITDRVRTLIRSDLAYFVSKPKFSIVMPVYNTPVRFLREAIDSIRNQIYGNWELCICDDGSNVEIINELEKYALLDGRIKVVRSNVNLGISEATNQALALASGEFVGLMDHDDLLLEAALYYVAKAINDDPSIDIIYTDKDHVTERGQRTDPYFKPDWSPHTILSHNYMIHFLVFRKSLLNEVGRLRKEFDGSQDYDLILRLVEKAERIRHIPKVLYSWRRHPGSASLVPKAPAYEAARLAVQDAVNRRGDSAVVENVAFSGPYKVSYTLRKRPTVSIIISTGDDLKFLERCWSVLAEKTTYNNYEIVIATNILNNGILRKFCEQKGCKLVEEEDGFFSKMNNSAAAVAQGEYVVFLNDDTEIVTPQWIEEMLSLCQNRDVAAVAPKLIYPNGQIQFTRMVFGIQRDGMPYFFDPFAHFNASILFGFSSEVISDVSAVSGACMMVKKADFLKIGGFDSELFNLSWQDIDLCLKFRDMGYSVLYTPYAVIIHYGASTKKRIPSIFRKDVEAANIFFKKYQDLLLRGDSFYNNNLSDVQAFIEAPHILSVDRIDVSKEYGNAYWEHYCFPLYPKGDFLRNRNKTVQAFVPFASKIRDITGCRKIVDIGCGPAMLIEAFQKLGVDAWGIECSHEAIEYAPLPTRDKIFHGDICSPEAIAKLSSQRPFAAAICIEVLEHIPMEKQHEAVRNISTLSDTIIVTTPQPNLWDRDDKTHVCVMPRRFWVDLFKRAGYVEDKQKGKKIFGYDYELNQDTNMFVFLKK